MAQLQLIIRNARLSTHDTELHNIGIRKGLIVALAHHSEDLGPADEILDAAGRWVIPGAIDTHSHINQPSSRVRPPPQALVPTTTSRGRRKAL